VRACGIEAFVLAAQREWTEFHLRATADCKTCVGSILISVAWSSESRADDECVLLAVRTRDAGLRIDVEDAYRQIQHAEGGLTFHRHIRNLDCVAISDIDAPGGMAQVEVFDFAARKRAFPPTRAEIDRYPPVRHPLVRTHPYTGRKCLYVMRDDSTGIEGIEQDGAETLIAALADHIVKPAYVYRHQWRPGDLLMWDNCTVQHRAIQDYDLPQRRLMHRTTMGGAVPI